MHRVYRRGRAEGETAGGRWISGMDANSSTNEKKTGCSLNQLGKGLGVRTLGQGAWAQNETKNIPRKQTCAFGEGGRKSVRKEKNQSVKNLSHRWGSTILF